MLPRRRARGIEEALLSDQHERARGDTAAGDRVLARGDLVQRAAEVDGPGAQAFRGAPGNGPVERVIDLEDADATPVAAQLRAIPGREPVGGDPVELRRRHVAEIRARRGELGERRHAATGLDGAAKRAQPGGERVGDALRPAARDRPADHVPQHGEHETERRGERRVQRQHRMRRYPREESAGALAAERRAREHAGRTDGHQTEPRHRERVARDAQERPERILRELVPVRDERRDEPAIGSAVGAEPLDGALEGSLQHDGGAVVERVRHRRIGLDPLEALPRKVERAQERRGRAHRMERRADVVSEPRKRQLGGAAAPADGLVRFVDDDASSASRELDRCAEPVGSGADDDGVSHATSPLSARCSGRTTRACAAGRRCGWRSG